MKQLLASLRLIRIVNAVFDCAHIVFENIDQKLQGLIVFFNLQSKKFGNLYRFLPVVKISTKFD
jgi:hypothetical protein